MIWLCLIIPVLTTILLVSVFHKHIVWWEYLLVMAIPTIAIVIANYTAVHFQTQDTEYWNSYGVRASYYERWDEYVHQTCTRENCSGSGDSRTCTTETYDCSYVDDHPAYWEISDNTGKTHTMDEGYFMYLTKHWGNKTFQDMNRDYHSYDGDAYYTKFLGDFDKIVSICKPHTYENKVMVSKSVFNFQKVDTGTISDLGLYEYPNTGMFDFDPILGNASGVEDELLNKYNALNGAKKQLHMMLLIFKDKPREAAMMQESYWKGGNKNEFIVCIGTSAKQIKWTKVISWTDEEALKLAVESDVLTMDTLNVIKVVEYMGKTIPPRFVRKQFADFNYLKIEPSMKSIMITLLITILVSAGLAVFVIKNKIDI